MSMMGLASRPGTDVDPTCSMHSASSPSTKPRRSASRLNNRGQSGSYATRVIGALCGSRVPTVIFWSSWSRRSPPVPSARAPMSPCPIPRAAAQRNAQRTLCSSTAPGNLRPEVLEVTGAHRMRQLRVRQRQVSRTPGEGCRAGAMSGRGVDFFISHAGRDTGWAEWLAWQLQEAGYTVELDVWDWAPGEDFVARMGAALERADRLLAVCTEAYFASAFGGAELRAAFAVSAAAGGRIVPVLVEPVPLPPLYAPLIPLDLTGLDEAAAAARLRARLTGGQPTSAPPFPRVG